MNGLVGVMALGVITSLIATELFALGPWLAERIVRKLARRFPTPVGPRLEEEWLAVLVQRPGGLMKLMFAVGLVVGARRIGSACGMEASHSSAQRAKSFASALREFASRSRTRWTWLAVVGSGLGGVFSLVERYATNDRTFTLIMGVFMALGTALLWMIPPRKSPDSDSHKRQ